MRTQKNVPILFHKTISFVGGDLMFVVVVAVVVFIELISIYKIEHEFLGLQGVVCCLLI